MSNHKHPKLLIADAVPNLLLGSVFGLFFRVVGFWDGLEHGALKPLPADVIHRVWETKLETQWSPLHARTHTQTDRQTHPHTHTQKNNGYQYDMVTSVLVIHL